MKINWSWPSTPENNLMPWYRICWQLLWFPLFFFGRVCCTVAILIASMSTTEAKTFWEFTS